MPQTSIPNGCSVLDGEAGAGELGVPVAFTALSATVRVPWIIREPAPCLAFGLGRRWMTDNYIIYQ